jgi:transposase
MGRRTFTTAFKVQVVRELLGGGVSQAAVARRYEVAPDQIARWRERYEQGTLVEGPAGDQALHARIAELERLVGRLALENELLKKAEEFALRQRNGHSSRDTRGSGSSRGAGGAA